MGRARRKDKESGSGSSSPGLSSSLTQSGSSTGGNNQTSNSGEAKLYVEPTVLECTLPEPKIRELVNLPAGLDYNEWLASHTIAFFDHINLLYGTVSEYCTMSGCPDMTGPKYRQYLWFDEKGKKARVTAPQYIDYVMTFTQKTVNDESIFPTKFERDFPSTFESTVKKIHRLLFHVVAHLYHGHFQELVLLNLHGHLNCLFIHFILFNDQFRVIEDKETEVLHDLAQALKLYPDASLEGNISMDSSTDIPDSLQSLDLEQHRRHLEDSPPVGESRFFSGPSRDPRDTNRVLTRPPTSSTSVHHFASAAVPSDLTALHHSRTNSAGGRTLPYYGGTNTATTTNNPKTCGMQDSAAALVHFNPNNHHQSVQQSSNSKDSPTSSTTTGTNNTRIRSSPIKFQ